MDMLAVACACYKGHARMMLTAVLVSGAGDLGTLSLSVLLIMQGVMCPTMMVTGVRPLRNYNIYVMCTCASRGLSWAAMKNCPSLCPTDAATMALK